MENMELWDKVSKTDPNHTKKVNQRGGFTAIDAHYQIQNATKAFGPVGIGWGYIVEKMERFDSLIVVHVTMWHGNRDNKFGPILGCAEMFGKRSDSDAPKKATTDAITKGLSHLGFNADVFLGLFDDNKYVAGLKAENSNPAFVVDNIASQWIEAVKKDEKVINQIADPAYKAFIQEQLK